MLAVRQGADHDASKTFGHRFFEHFGGEFAVLQRHGGQRRKAALVAELFPHAIVEITRPRRTLCRRQFVTEAVEPAADHLVIDAVFVHPRLTFSEVGEFRHDGPRRRDAGELDGHPLVAF